MTDYPFKLDKEAALAAMLYILEQVPGISKLHLSKLLYFADKAHLEKWGRMITGDQYKAMERGPVPSGILRMMDQVDTAKNNASMLFAPEMAEHIRIAPGNGLPLVWPLHGPDLDDLSDSDIECLDEVVREYGHITDGRIMSERSHDASWHRTARNQTISVESLATEFDNFEQLLEHIGNRNP